MPDHPKFAGNEQDLGEFLKVASSPVRSDERAERLAEWDEYKFRRLQDDQVRRYGQVARGWLLSRTAPSVIDLRGATLDGICVGTVDLRGVRLDGASMRGAWLKGARLTNASLRGVDFGPLEGSPIPGGFGHGASRLGFADFGGADLTGAILTDAWLEGVSLVDSVLDDADLRGSDLSHAAMARTSLLRTDLRGARVYGASVWDVELCDDERLRWGLQISPRDEPPVYVDDLEVAQLIHLLLKGPKLRNVLNAVTKRGVLLLGRFREGGLTRLHAMADVLRGREYLPMIFDFDRPDDRDYTETVKVLAGLSRFIVADLSGGSVPAELMATVPHFEVPLVAVLQRSEPQYSTFQDLLKHPWVHDRVIRFTEIADLLEALPAKVVEPAERILGSKATRQVQFDDT